MSRPPSPTRAWYSRLVTLLSARSWASWFRTRRQTRREQQLLKVQRQRDLLLEPLLDRQGQLLEELRVTRRLLVQQVEDQNKALNSLLAGQTLPTVDPEEIRDLLLEVLSSLQQPADTQISQQLGLPPRRT